MFWIGSVILASLWLAGLILQFTAGGFIHLLLILAVAFLLLQLMEVNHGGSRKRT